MDKTPRKKKALNIKLDTKNVDATFERKVDESVEVNIDTDVVDVHYTKDVDGNKSLTIEIDDAKQYDFVANGESSVLPKGSIWKVTGELARILIKKGFGKLKK
jgi:hypothetical protein